MRRRQLSSERSRHLVAIKFIWLKQVCSDHEISHLAARIAALLLDYINPATGAAWPSQATLATAAGVSRRGVQKALTALETAGHLRITVQKGRANTNRYRPLLKNANHAADFGPQLANVGDEKSEPKFARLPQSNLSPLPPYTNADAPSSSAPSVPTGSERAAIGQQVIELARALGSKKATRLGGDRHD